MKATCPIVLEDDVWRAYVPFEMTYECPRHGITESASGMAMIDTGAPRCAIGAHLLPAGHVALDDLAEIPNSWVPTMHGDMRSRWWDARVTVMGVEVVTRWKVLEANRPSYPIFGLQDFGRAFRFAFDLGSSPPTFSIDPYPYQNLQPVPIESFDIIRYGDRHGRLVPGTTPPFELAGEAPQYRLTETEPGRLAIEAGGLALSEPAGLSRPARRRLARAAGGGGPAAS